MVVTEDQFFTGPVNSCLSEKNGYLCMQKNC